MVLQKVPKLCKYREEKVRGQIGVDADFRLGFSEYDIIYCLDEENVNGTGIAYKATLSNGKVAIKRLWRSGKSDASNDNGFKVEVDTLE
jgi:hypothetical protein